MYSEILSTESEAPSEVEERLLIPNTETEDSPPSLLRKVQVHCNLASHILSLCLILLVSWWVSELGGLSWELGKAKVVFNWHPLLMITAFAFMTVATLAFRFPYSSSRRSIVKLSHIIAWLIAAFCAMIGLKAVFQSHNDHISGLIANLYSFHSWMGMTVVLLYSVQFFVGFFSFAVPLRFITPQMKRTVLELHKFAGPCIYYATAATILLGIQEKEGFVGCSYHVTKISYLPMLGKIPGTCWISHLLGLLVVATTLSTSIALLGGANASHDDSSRHREH